jgi:hypothetical protein
MAYERHVRLLCRLHLRFPFRLERVVADDGRRHHESSLGFVDVALAQLRIREPRTMTDQLVGE